jgi:hypothetical protein
LDTAIHSLTRATRKAYVKARGLSAEKMEVLLPVGPTSIFSLTPAIFCKPLRLAVFFSGIAGVHLVHGAVFRH